MTVLLFNKSWKFGIVVCSTILYFLFQLLRFRHTTGGERLQHDALSILCTIVQRVPYSTSTPDRSTQNLWNFCSALAKIWLSPLLIHTQAVIKWAAIGSTKSGPSRISWKRREARTSARKIILIAIQVGRELTWDRSWSSFGSGTQAHLLPRMPLT